MKYVLVNRLSNRVTQTKWAFWLLILFPTLVAAGDYLLTISDNPSAACVQTAASRDSKYLPIRSADEVAEDVRRYFCGEKPDLDLFVAAFQNARIEICGPRERRQLYEAFLEVLDHHKIQNERHLYDYMFMLGSRELLAMIDQELATGPAEPRLGRLRKARRAVVRGVEARGP